MTASYWISSNGLSMGTYEAGSEEEAIQNYIRSAGYLDATHMAEVLSQTADNLLAELHIERVPATPAERKQASLGALWARLEFLEFRHEQPNPDWQEICALQDEIARREERDQDSPSWHGAFVA